MSDRRPAADLVLEAGVTLVWLPFDPAVIGGVPAGLEVEVFDARGDLPASGDRVAFYVPDYRFDRRVVEVIPRLPRLQVVQTLTAGVDHVRPHLPRGVTLCNARGVHDTSTAELAVALTLASQRGIPDFVRAQPHGRWAFDTYPALADHTVLIVGYGSIGAAVERRLQGFECDVLRVARRARDGVADLGALARLLPAADVVILAVPLTPQTHHLVDAEFLARMRDGALLVNVARGPVVDTTALTAACASGRLRAALDVTDPEPLPADHPLWTTRGVLVSPHVGGASSAFWPRAHALVREQLARYADGRPLLNVMTDAY
ncbi:MAG: 2-hydroxyacid dehydrogenase [Actinomycetota bacterium]|nr:2-hydroxyacid dehydrogenase [Actinomycetota bacterium]